VHTLEPVYDGHQYKYYLVTCDDFSTTPSVQELVMSTKARHVKTDAQTLITQRSRIKLPSKLRRNVEYVILVTLEMQGIVIDHGTSNNFQTLTKVKNIPDARAKEERVARHNRNLPKIHHVQKR
jgi:hypothetical protein